MRLITLKTDSLRPELRRLQSNLSPLKLGQVTFAAAKEFQRITLANMGASGEARPTPWTKLTKHWAARKHTDRTPTLVYKGNLQKSIVAVSNPDGSATVGSELPYAAVHQDGGGNSIPARRYFPVLGGQLTPYAEGKITTVITTSLDKLLK